MGVHGHVSVSLDMTELCALKFWHYTEYGGCRCWHGSGLLYSTKSRPQLQGHCNVVVCSHSHMPSPPVAALSTACIGVGYMYAGVTQAQQGWQDLVRPHTSSACTELPSARLTQRCSVVAVSETTCMSRRTQLLTSLCLLMLTARWLCV